MKIRASAKPSITDSGTVFLLNSSGILLSRTIYVEEAWGDYGYGLLPGVYYLVAKPNIYEGYKSTVKISCTLGIFISKRFRIGTNVNSCCHSFFQRLSPRIDRAE